MEKQFKEKVMKASGYRAAKNRQLKLMRKGLDLGTRVKIAFSRDELRRDKPIAKIGYFEGIQTRIPLKDTVQFVGDIVSPAIKKDRKASK